MQNVEQTTSKQKAQQKICRKDIGGNASKKKEKKKN